MSGWPTSVAAVGLLLVSAVASPQGEAVELLEVNASLWPGHQGEVSIAVDRYRPHRVVAATMNIDDGRLLVLASGDRGASWSARLIPLSEGALHADPMVAFDSGGRVHLAVIPVGGGNTPLGIDMMYSDDGGLSWSPAVRVTKATGRDDKLALVVDDGLHSAYRDRVYVAWKWPSGGIFQVTSNDRGASFSRPRLIDTARVSGLDMSVSDDGALYLAASDGMQQVMRVMRSTDDGALYLAASDGMQQVMRVMRSTDGGASFLPSVVVAPVRAQWYTSQPSHCARQSLVHATIAVDRSAGPREGEVYLAWADFAIGQSPALCRDSCDPASPCTTDIFWSRSSDGGISWSAPASLAGGMEGGDRYFPWLRTDPESGVIYLAYKDSRLDRSRRAVDVYLSRSADGGASWEAPTRLSTKSSDATASGGFQYGDYQGLAVAPGLVFAAWSDYRSPDDGEIYVGRAAFPVATGDRR